MELNRELLKIPARVLLGFTLLLFISPKVDQSQLDGSRGLRRGIHVQGNRISYGNFAVDKFHHLQVLVGSSTLVSNYSECALSCVNISSCSSFNVASSPKASGKYRCELLNEDKYSANPGQLVSSQEYHHYSIKTPCSSFPCQNDAKCVPNYDENEYHCDCVSGYTGRLCETDINECSSNPCLNGATCVDQVNGYVCNCQPGYAGVNCETNINECSSNPCLNGATCVDQVNGYVCYCRPGYAATYCQTNINECSSNPCLNGATCVDQVNGYVCNCQPGYAGVHCQSSSQQSWLDYTPEWCGSIDNRREIIRGITAEECKQQHCSNCAAIEYWSGSKTCYECFDHTTRKPYTNTGDGWYPPHVFVRQ
ncbi:hypothetical protein ACROYT_G039917 [Oculina patagonica]